MFRTKNCIFILLLIFLCNLFSTFVSAGIPSIPKKSIKGYEDYTYYFIDSLKTYRFFDYDYNYGDYLTTIFANQPIVDGVGIFIADNSLHTWEYRYDCFYKESKVLTKDNKPVLLPGAVADFDREGNFIGSISIQADSVFHDIQTNPDKYEFKTYNCCIVSYSWPRGLNDPKITPVKVILHGKDLTSICSKACAKHEGKISSKEKSEYLARCKKYGKKYVDIREASGIPVVGMPYGLLVEYGLQLVQQTRTSKVYQILGFRCKVTVTNGRVSKVITW